MGTTMSRPIISTGTVFFKISSNAFEVLGTTEQIMALEIIWAFKILATTALILLALASVSMMATDSMRPALWMTAKPMVVFPISTASNIFIFLNFIPYTGGLFKFQ